MGPRRPQTPAFGGNKGGGAFEGGGRLFGRVLEFEFWVFEHVIEEDDEFADDGGEGDELAFPRGQEAIVEGFEDGIAAAGGESGHVESTPDGDAAPGDAPQALVGAAIAIVGGDAGESGGFLLGEFTQLGHFGDEHGGNDGANAWNLLATLGAFLQFGIARLELSDGGFDGQDLFGEELSEFLVGFFGGGKLVMRSLVLELGAHLDELAAFGDQLGEFLGLRRTRRSGFGIGGGAEAGEHGGIDGVGFGEATDAKGIGADPAWENHADGEVGPMEGADNGLLITAGRFEDDLERGSGESRGGEQLQ